MRMILLAGLALAVSARGGGNDATEANEANAMIEDNLMLDQNAMMADPTMNGTMGMDANMTGDANTQNLMVQDATTNDPDTNLANGL